MDFDALKEFLIRNGIIKNYNKDKAILSPILISYALLKSDSNMDNLIDKLLLDTYVDKVMEIWQPFPEDKRVYDLTSEKVKKAIPEIQKKPINIQQETLTPVNYVTVKKWFDDWNSKIIAKHKEFQKEFKTTSNPFFTASISDSYSTGEEFQKGAKTASSLETVWGNNIEDIFFYFNPNLITVKAGGFDYVLNGIAYDLKSGPQVMNGDQVKEANTKRQRIVSLYNNVTFNPLLSVKDFQVAIVYGRYEIANSFMKKEPGLIIYGKDTWRILSGDEANAFKFFLWQIKFKSETNTSWNKLEFCNAVNDFSMSFYGENKIPEQLLSLQEYQELEKKFV